MCVIICNKNEKVCDTQRQAIFSKKNTDEAFQAEKKWKWGMRKVATFLRIYRQCFTVTNFSIRVISIGNGINKRKNCKLKWIWQTKTITEAKTNWRQHFFPSINSLDLSFALFLIFSFWYRVWFGKTKLAISILIHLQYSCECDLAALHCLCKYQNVKLDRALMLELWNSSPTYLNQVNKNEFCLHFVCIILCLLFGKHYYTPMWTWLRVCFCLLELNYGLRQWQRHRWQTTSPTTTVYESHTLTYMCISQ